MSGRPQKTRIRKRPISFGNPSTATYHGDVYTVDILDPSQPRPLMEGATEVQRIVAMVQVPPEQVPEGVLNLVRSHRPWIEHIRIVIEDADDGADDNNSNTPRSTQTASDPLPFLSAPLVSPSVLAAENAASIIAAEELLSSNDKRVEQLNHPPPSLHESLPPSRTYLILFELSSDDAVDQMIHYLHGQPYTCLDETQLCSLYPVVALQGENGVSLMSPFFAPTRKASDDGGLLEIVPTKSSSSSSENTNHDNDESDGSILLLDGKPPAEDYYNCAVCLEHMQLVGDTNNNKSGERTSILTTVCNHSFHIDCLLQWQDSPCPVCRYDHSGLNSALSQCSACGKTENNFVCLICGVVSCGGGTFAAAEAAASVGRDDSNCSASPIMPDLNMASSHARQHYDETLHAYALDTENQHVWDFAGQGYVHRLLQNKDDGKLVEVSDPNSHVFERSPNPGLSEAQEGEVVHRKLEGFASQYYTLLKSQLEQQRIYYEGRLEEIRRDDLVNCSGTVFIKDFQSRTPHVVQNAFIVTLCPDVSSFKTERILVKSD